MSVFPLCLFALGIKTGITFQVVYNLRIGFCTLRNVLTSVIVIISYVDSCGRNLEVYYHVGLAISKLIKPWKEVHILSDFHLMLNKQFGRELHKQKDVPWVRNSPIYYCSEYPQFFFPEAHVFFKPHCWSGWNYWDHTDQYCLWLLQ